jgi:molybdate transport system substrate-binding protein
MATSGHGPRTLVRSNVSIAHRFAEIYGQQCFGRCCGLKSALRLLRRAIGGIALALVCSLPSLELRAAQVTVFAASSLTDSLKEVAGAYESKTGDKIVFNFAASSVLARQIEEGAPADIFFSADEAKMDALETKGLVVKGTRGSPLSNLLVIVTAQEKAVSIKSVYDLTNSTVQRLALADPKTVPIGIYAREYLQKARLWDVLLPKAIIVENVRAALAAVEAGNADAAFVYKTDAAISKKANVAVQIPGEEGPKISYSVALVENAPHGEAAKAFLGYTMGEDAAKVFQKFGFITLPQTPNK